MTNNIDISIIIPIFNGEKYINNLISNIKEFNNMINYEIIFVNDCSKDNSKQICEEIASRNSYVVLVNNEKNIGIAESRNKGLNIANGKYVTFIDQDDSLTNSYSSFIAVLNNNDADFLYSNYSILNKETTSIEQVNLSDKTCDKNEIIKLERFLFNPTTFPINGNYSIKSSIWNCIFRNSFIKENNLKFLRYTSYEDDWLFLIESLKKANKVYLTKDSYYCWAISNKSESHVNKYIDDYFNKSLKLLDYATNSLIETGLTKSNLKDYLLHSNRTIFLWNFYNECESDIDLRNNVNIKSILKYYNNDINSFIKVSSTVDKIMLFLISHKLYNLAKYIQINIIKRKYV